MKRRHFIHSSLVSAAIPLTYAASTGGINKKNAIVENEIYELRTYELTLRGDRKLFFSYLDDALKPALGRLGANHILQFTEIGNSDPKKIWLLISYPDSNSYMAAQSLSADQKYMETARSYHNSPAEQPIYSRFESSLFRAFDGMKQMNAPVDGATVFELRTYEGYNEDAVRRKIKMFNEEEFPLFYKVGLNPIFFGDMISGPYRPALTYMLNFTDMDAHDKAWKSFLDSEEWNKMKVKPVYANTVSQIRKVYLELM